MRCMWLVYLRCSGSRPTQEPYAQHITRMSSRNQIRVSASVAECRRRSPPSCHVTRCRACALALWSSDTPPRSRRRCRGGRCGCDGVVTRARAGCRANRCTRAAWARARRAAPSVRPRAPPGPMSAAPSGRRPAGGGYVAVGSE